MRPFQFTKQWGPPKNLESKLSFAILSILLSNPALVTSAQFYCILLHVQKSLCIGYEVLVFKFTSLKLFNWNGIWVSKDGCRPFFFIWVIIIIISSTFYCEMSVFNKQFSLQLLSSQLRIYCNFDERLINCGCRNMSAIKTSAVRC